MRLLLEEADAVRSRFARGGPVLVALDYDGTLTEIIDDPKDPALRPQRRQVLARVPGPGRWLAVVSGRALADVRARIGIERAIYVGNHGLEIAAPGLVRRFAPPGTEDRLSALLASLPLTDAVVVENKTLTATLHVRPRDDDRRHAALGEAVQGAVEAAGFVLRPGKASWEIRPADAPDKGDAIRCLIDSLPGAGPERTVYIGDDATDEDAFLALPEAVTARVGPPGVATAARYRLPDPAAVYRFLEMLTG
ncbi:MAG: trehalose-phosphatase [Gemmatimonadota bacterium]